MIVYNPLKHELVLTQLYLDLRSDPAEFDNLFMKSLQSLTGLLNWASGDLRLAFEVDERGIWIATWLVPAGAGAYFGVWVRKDKRQNKAMLKFVNDTLDAGLENVKVIVAYTRQE